MECLQLNASSIAQRAQELVAQHPHFRGRVQLFEFEFADGVLVIHGRVSTFYLKQLLQHTVQ